MKFNSTKSRPGVSRQPAEGGYILLVLLLFVALLTIAAAAIAPSIAFQVRRDREEELIHRGVQYSRAVRHYFKKFNRYPSKIEDLESTNNLRFLRKRYKDPLTGNDFKLLRLGDVPMALGAGAIGGLTPSANSASGGGGLFGQSTSGLGGGSAANNKPAPALGSTDNSDVSDPGSNDPATANASGSSTPRNAGANANQPDASGTNTDKLGGQTFGGGPIVGVMSTNKAQSIREFNKKNHYNEWLFIYDPQSDRGGLLNTPAQPALQGAVSIGQPPNGTLGTSGSGFGPPGLGGQGLGNQGLGNQGLGNQGAGNQASPFGGGMQQPSQNSQPQPEPQQ